MNNLSSYCGLVHAKIRASDKDLPVPTGMSLCLKIMQMWIDSITAIGNTEREISHVLLGAFFNYVIQILTTYLSQVDIGKQFLYFYIRENLNIIDMDFQY